MLLPVPPTKAEKAKLGKWYNVIQNQNPYLSPHFQRYMPYSNIALCGDDENKLKLF